MTTADPTKIRRLHGRLYNGSTALGLTRDQEFWFGQRQYSVMAEEWGTPHKTYLTGEFCIFVCVLRQIDSDALSAIFPNISGTTITSAPASSSLNRAGYELSLKAFVLKWIPIETSAPTLTVLSAVPILEESASMRLSLASEMGLPVAFIGTPDSDGKTWTFG